MQDVKMDKHTAQSNKKDSVVILGAGIMQMPIIESANNMGLISIVFDGNNNAPGKKLSTYFENIDLKDHDSLLEKSIYYNNICNIRAVFTAGTDFSYMVAWLSEKLGLKSISYETALKATDKSLMREAFSSANVSSPLFIMTTDININEDQVQKLGYPLVVKPVDSMGARGAVKIHDFHHLKDAIKEAIKFSRSGKVIIEQFLQGAEFSLDAVIKDGNIHICGVADRHIYFPPYFVEMGHTMPSAFPKEAVDKIINVFCDGIRAIGIDNGAAKGDIKYTDGKASIGEIAARLSGGYMSGWTFPYSTGFSVIDAALKIALDSDPGEIKYSYNKTAAE
ncbi:MAG: ATP-grasp domain-containing protein, partial [Spirochaetaceae bacterium]|nr:ATP-grasp domain-containing protein [Spirochaetaceae bacterium]